MLGEKLGEFHGKSIGMRVIGNNDHDHHHGPRMEISMHGQGKILGVETTDTGTYESCFHQHGNYFTGTGRGVSMTNDGEVITWTVTGVGKLTGKGMAINWRGSVHYETTSKKLEKLNSTCVVYEYDVDEKGDYKGSGWEWR